MSSDNYWEISNFNILLRKYFYKLYTVMETVVKKINHTLVDFESCHTSSQILKGLNTLGKLPVNFDEKYLLIYLSNPSDKIRLLSIKNLAKLSKLSLLSTFLDIIKFDKSSLVRREATSAIGRLRNEKAIEVMFKLLRDDDPELILQAIRGLLIFKKDNIVAKKLLELKTHSNEIIQEVIKKEFKLDKKTTNDLNHTQSPDFMKNKLVEGDVTTTIQLVPNESIHLTFTSPPYYNARDYSIYKSYNEYLSFLEGVFKEIHRITKEGRFFVLNTSPIIIPRIGRQYASKRYPIPYDLHPLLVKMGWEFIDDIIWKKPEASVKNRNAGFLQHRNPLGYKANACTECVMVYRKKTDKLIDWNIKQYDKQIVEESKINGDYESSNIWKIDPTFDKTHSAVFPIELCNKVIKFYSFKGDLVFDPFAGSGTFGKSAINLNRFFFLTEREKKYIGRIKENIDQQDLFFKDAVRPDFLNISKFSQLSEIYKNERK